MLLMKKMFFDAIRRGQKTTTLRYWHSPRAKPGSVHTVPGLGRLAINDIRAVRPADLTDDDARADGFDSLRALRKALNELYPVSKRQGRTLYRVTFRYVGDDQPNSANDASKNT